MFQIGKRTLILSQSIAKCNKFFNKTTILIASDHGISNKNVTDDCSSKLGCINNKKTMGKQLIEENINFETNLLKPVKLQTEQSDNLNEMNQIPVSGTVEVLYGVKTEKADIPHDSKETSQQPDEIRLKKKKKQPVEVPVDFGRLDFRVGKIVEVQKHSDADSLYIVKIDCDEPQVRQVVSGLVKFVSIEDLKDRMVVVMCNLKPAKMRGVISEAMVMCASTSEKVEILSPPTGAVPGDLVYCEGFTRNPDIQLNPKKKIFETCVPDLSTNDLLQACYKNSPWNIPGKGFIVSQTLMNVNVR